MARICRLKDYKDPNNFQLDHPYWEDAEKSVCIVRYGGYGDMMQVASILPWLKEQGYHTVVNTTPRGHSVLEHDPHIDTFLLQETGQVPNEHPKFELPRFWTVLAHCFTKFINLSESAEGRMLAIQGRPEFYWPYKVRQKYLDGDLMEFTHDLAEVPMPPRFKFYPSRHEERWATRHRKKIRKKYNGKFVVAWVLGGSSVNKVWPFVDSVLARFLVDTDDICFVLLGDYTAQIAEVGWEAERRVICTSDKWSIREAIAFAQQSDLVIGPETGVMFAVGRDPIPKIIFLSHGSKNNLYQHFENTVVLSPPQKDVPCHPCHQIHHGFDYCHRHEDTGVALCQAMISPDWVIKIIDDYYNHARESWLQVAR